MSTLPRQHQYWMAVRNQRNRITYRFYPMVVAADHTISFAEEQVVEATVRDMIEQGAKLLLEVDDLRQITRTRVLYSARSGTAM